MNNRKREYDNDRTIVDSSKSARFNWRSDSKLTRLDEYSSDEETLSMCSKAYNRLERKHNREKDKLKRVIQENDLQIKYLQVIVRSYRAKAKKMRYPAMVGIAREDCMSEEANVFDTRSI